LEAIQKEMMVFSQSCEADAALFSFLEFMTMIKFDAMNVNMLEHMAMLDSYIAIGMDSSLRERTNIVLGIQLVSFIIDEEDFHTRRHSKIQ